MKSPAPIIVTLLLMGLPPVANGQDHVEVDAQWKNSSAEELVEQLAPLSREAELAVVDDGKATIYFKSEPSEVAGMLRKLEDKFPKDLLVVRTARIPGEIPAGPKQTEQQRMKISISREKSALLGITADAINNHLRSLRGEASDAEWVRKIHHETITTADGRKVPVTELLTVTMIEVKRPLIINKTSNKGPSDGKMPVLPPPEMNLKEDWTTIERKNYSNWEIAEFVSWSGVADGGSTAFEFRTTKEIRFDVLVANPAYWTAEDKEKQQQVVYLVESGRFYRLKRGSEHEKLLIGMLKRLEKGLKEDGLTSKKRIVALRETIESRKAVKDHWPLTAEKIEADKNSPTEHHEDARTPNSPRQ